MEGADAAASNALTTESGRFPDATIAFNRLCTRALSSCLKNPPSRAKPLAAKEVMIAQADFKSGVDAAAYSDDTQNVYAYED